MSMPKTWYVKLWWFFFPYLGWKDLSKDDVAQISWATGRRLDQTLAWEGFMFEWLWFGFTIGARPKRKQP